ncbi:MAG: hypothetical protein JKP96_06685 [Oceanicaulis sp.]|jgi:hypothetical protein|nr:hypothetical protein [Oceanicaulis sp.]
MGVLADINPTMADLIASLDPDGKTATVLEILNETNEILDDLTMIQGNLSTGHRHTIRTGIPEPTLYKLYGSVKPNKSKRAQITDSAAMYQGYMELDPELLKLPGGAGLKSTEAVAHIEGYGQRMARDLFYANEAHTPEGFTGLAPRFNDLNAENGDNIIDAGGVGSDNFSIWLVGWSPLSCFTFYPHGSEGGLVMTPKGVQTIPVDDGYAERDITHTIWNLGLGVGDWRFVGRIVNIDISALKSDASTGADLIELMTMLTERVERRSGVRYSWYVPKKIREILRLQIVNKVKNSTLSREEVAGRKVIAFDGDPVRRCDCLSIPEARVIGL